MFDANMRHLPKGKEFFCKVHYWDNCPYEFDNSGIVKCKMVDNDNTDPLVVFETNKGKVFIRHYDFFYDKLCVYEGNLDGTSFINEESKRIAMERV